MALTAETIASLDISQVLKAYEAEQRAMLAIEAESVALGIKKKDLIKAYNQTEAASKAWEKQAAAEAAKNVVVAKSTGTAAAGAASLRAQVADIYVSLQGGQNPFTVLSQQGPQVAEALAAMGVSMASVAAAALPLVAIGAPLAAAIYLDVKAEEAATKAAEKRKEAVDALVEALDQEQKANIDLYGDLQELNTRYDVATGKISKQTATHNSETQALQAKGKVLTGDAKAAVDAALAAEKLVLQNKKSTEQQKIDAAWRVRDAREKQKEAIKTSETTQATLALVQHAEDEAAEAEKRRDAAKKKGLKTKKDDAAAEREAAEALRAEIAALLAAEKAEQAHYAAIRKGVKALEDQEAAAKRTVQTDYERIEAEKMAALEIGNSIARVALMEARTDEERRDIARSLASARIAIEQKANAEIIDSQKAAAKKASEELQTIASAGLSSAESLASSLASLTTEKIAQSEERISDLQDAIDAAEANGQTVKAANLKKRKREEEKGLRATFDAGQDLARAGVVMNTAQAIMAAYAQLGPIAGSFAAAAATAIGAIELAVVNKQEPPKFNDTPGIMEGTGNGTQRQIVSLDPRDKWLAARDMDGLMKQFLGAMSGGRRGTASLTPRNEAMLAYNAVGAYGQDIARITRPGGF